MNNNAKTLLKKETIDDENQNGLLPVSLDDLLVDQMVDFGIVRRSIEKT